MTGTLNIQIASKLALGFALAARQVEQQQECRALFSDLGSVAETDLLTSTYGAATTAMERTICRHADAVTVLGSRRTWLCRSFGRISTRLAAAILVHEALHSAGLDEQPHDPEGLTSSQITRVVQQRCGL